MARRAWLAALAWVTAACGAGAAAPAAPKEGSSLLEPGQRAPTLPEGALLRLGKLGLVHPGLQGFGFASDNALWTWGIAPEGAGVRAKRWEWPDVRATSPEVDLENVIGVAASGRFLLASVGGRFGAFDVAKGAITRRFAAEGGYLAALSADGRTIAYAEREPGSVALLAEGAAAPRVLDAHDRDVLALAFEPKGQLLATSSEDDTVKLWDVATGNLVRSLETHRDAYDPAFSADGKRLMARTEDRVLVWDVASGAIVARIGEDDHDLYLGGGAALSPDGKRVAISMATGDGTLSMFDLEPLRVAWQTRDAGAYTLAFSPGGDELVIRGAYDETLQRLAVSDGQRLPRGEDPQAAMTALASSAEHAYTADVTGAISVWSLADGQRSAVLRGHDRSVRALSLSADGKRLASGGLDRTVVIWDVEARTLVRRIVVPHEVSAVALSSDGADVVVAPVSGRASVWSVTDGRRVRALAGGVEGAAACSADGAWLALSQDGGVAIGAPSRWAARRVFPTPDQPTSMSFSADGTRLAAASSAALWVWSVKDGELLVERELGRGDPSSVVWAPSGDALALAVGPTIAVVSAKGARRMLFDGHAGTAVVALSFATDDRLVSASADGTALVWKVARDDEPGASKVPHATPRAAPQVLATCPPVRTDGYGDALPPCAVARYGSLRLHHESDIRRLAISPDGSLIAAGGGSSGSTVIRVWDRKAGALRAELAAGGEVPSMKFSPAGDRLYALSAGRVLSWSLDGDVDARSVAVGESDYDALALSPSGRLLAAANGMGEVRVLDAASLDLRGRFAVPDSQAVRLGFVGEDELVLQSMRLEVSRWSWKRGERLGRVADDLYGMTVLGDGRVVGAYDGLLRVGPASSVRATKIEAGDDEMAISSDGRRAAIVRTESNDEGEAIATRAHVYDLGTGRELSVLDVGETAEIALSPKGDALAVAKGARVELWDVASRKRAATPPTHESWVGGAGFTSDGKVVTLDRNSGVKLWNPETGERAGGWNAVDVTHGAVTPDGRSIAAAVSTDLAEQLVVWPVTGGPGRRKKVDVVSLEPMAITPDGKRFVHAVPLRREVEVIALDSLRSERRIAVTAEEVEAMAVSPDGRLVTTDDETSEVFDLSSGKRVASLDVGGGLAFSPSGAYLAIATGRTIELRDARTFEVRGVLESAVAARGDLVFSKDGWLASTDLHDGIQIWNVEERRLVTVLEGHEGLIDSLVVSPDGAELLSGSWDGTALRWDIRSLVAGAAE